MPGSTTLPGRSSSRRPTACRFRIGDETGQIAAHKLGKLWKFKTTEIDEWIQEGKAAEHSPKPEGHDKKNPLN